MNSFRRRERMIRSALCGLYEYLSMFVISVAVLIFTFTFIFRTAVVNGDSMRETLHNGDVLLITELFYTPEVQDIIVCQSYIYGYEEPLVKRIIATGGQKIEIDFESWTVTVDGTGLDEKEYVNYRDAVMHGWCYGESYTVSDGYVFVMGDNRNGSTDSRSAMIGPIDVRLIIGKAVYRLMPLEDIGTLY